MPIKVFKPDKLSIFCNEIFFGGGIPFATTYFSIVLTDMLPQVC